MVNQKLEVLHARLAVMHGLIQQGKAQVALSELLALQPKWPGNADVAHLIALAHKANDNFAQSVKYFSQTLDINKNQPQAHNNLANLYMANRLYAKAEKHYSNALSLQPNYFDALRNMALCQSAQLNYSTAIDGFGRLLKLQPNDVSALTGLADCYREMGVFDKAQQTYEKVLSIEPNHLNAWHNSGLNYHLNGRLEETLQCYKKAHSIAPDTAEVVQSYASTLHEAGFTSRAIAVFENALKSNPASVLLHERLNELLWEQGLAERFCSSYRRAIEQNVNSLDLHISYVNRLFRAAQIKQAAEQLELALRLFGGNFQLLSLKGQIEAEMGDYQAACSSLSESLAAQFTKDAAHALVKINLIQSAYESAQKTLNLLFETYPNCQLTWALQSLVWRFTDKDRYNWLNRYDRFVRVYKMKVPEGYASLEQFLHALEGVLLDMHRTQQAPLEQTLRHGTQTAARLLSKPVPEIVALQLCLNSIVHSYIGEMPDDLNHPLLGRKSEDFKFSGSWSVKLEPTGFHVNHVHPEGWISSAVYISIPSVITKDTTGLQGALKFGESPLGLGARDLVEKTIQPEPGTVVLFPSYMWHGTYPYTGAKNDFRLTAPFDVIPHKHSN